MHINAINHRPHSFFPPAQLRKSRRSSESPPSPSRRQERAAPLSPYLYSSVSPPQAGTWAKQQTSSPTTASSAPLTWLCAASPSAPLPGSARGCRLKINLWLLWNGVVLYVVTEGARGKGFWGEDGKDRARGGTDPFQQYFQHGAVLSCYLVQMNKITHWCL